LTRKKGKKTISDVIGKNYLILLWMRNMALQIRMMRIMKMKYLAREEKAAALRVITEARISLLIGSAGTGKTTLLSILANQAEIKSKGILLLAPTGKARVKMEQAMELSSKKDPNIKAYNIAQFLIKSKRYDPETGRFLLNDELPKRVGETVIIDEASMLTEEMLGALLQSIKGYKRLILVGDRYQLPPIGTGRPFVDIINEFEPENIKDEVFPKVGPSYAELIINRRQSLPKFRKCGKKVDIRLANWFRGNSVKATDDEIFDILNGSVKSKCLQIYQWEEEEEFRKLLFDVLKKELNLKNDSDFKQFNNSLGAINGSIKVGCAEEAENWQILSPVRNRTHGVSEINREIHQKFKGAYIRSSKSRQNKLKK
jgi:ATP-dependent exoDNAse (exonuclease V) alpha subunit